MIKMLYTVSPALKEIELQWLRDQKVYPACQDLFDWKAGIPLVGFGVLVNPETALAIKLRHKLDMQTEYKQR